MLIDAKEFKNATGLDPEKDDLERSNCERGGQEGHYGCGWNKTLNKPVFMVGIDKAK